MSEERPLRLLYDAGARLSGGPVHGCRWVYEQNGHPGACSPDHWHATAEEALVCFRGENGREVSRRKVG